MTEDGPNRNSPVRRFLRAPLVIAEMIRRPLAWLMFDEWPTSAETPPAENTQAPPSKVTGLVSIGGDALTGLWAILAEIDEPLAGAFAPAGLILPEGIPRLGVTEETARFTNLRAVLAVKENRRRLELAEELPCDWPTIIHPESRVSEESVIGPGTVIAADAGIGPGCVIGSQCRIGPGVGLAAHCRVGDGVTLAGGVKLATQVQIETGSILETDCTVTEGCTIGNWSRIRGNSVVMSDIPSQCLAEGAPARARQTAMRKAG